MTTTSLIFDADVHILVDPSFGRLFKLGRPSAAYRAFLAACVPEVFVGTLNMLLPLVKTVAMAVQMSFFETDMPLPPWRRENSLFSRWLPHQFVDVECSSCSTALTNEQHLRLKLQSQRLSTSSGNLESRSERLSCHVLIGFNPPSPAPCSPGNGSGESVQDCGWALSRPPSAISRGEEEVAVVRRQQAATSCTSLLLECPPDFRSGEYVLACAPQLESGSELAGQQDRTVTAVTKTGSMPLPRHSALHRRKGNVSLLSQSILSSGCSKLRIASH